jgi:hypothetical protein
VTVAPASNVTTGDRVIVEVGVWSGANATASSVTDSAGNAYVEVSQFTAADGTEMSVWTAPITKGGGTRPAVTAKATSVADIGAVVLEYSGLSTAADASVVDQSAHATGKTGSAGAVSSGSTMPTTASPELAIGFYADSGFGDSLVPDPGYAARANVSPNGNMELLVEDRVVTQGATPAASVTTGANTVWLTATLVFRHA